MLRFLKNLLGAVRRKRPDQEASPPDKPTPSWGLEMPVEHRGHLLLTRRSEIAMEDMPGFRETYFCTACRDYFVLAWQPKDVHPIEDARYQVVARYMLPDAKSDLDNLSIFCPQCGANYLQYGPVLWPEQLAKNMTLMEAFSVTWPQGTRARPKITDYYTLKGVVTEKVVVVVGGEFPEGLDREAFICTYLNAMLGQEARSICAQGAIEVDVLRVDNVTDDTGLLTKLLQEGPYRGIEWGVRIFLTQGPAPLNPPFQAILLCLVQPPFL